jgi:hypothetical protein
METEVQTRNVITDGYTRRAYVRPEPGIHDGMLFTYRPMLPEHVEELEATCLKAAALDKIRMMAAALAGGGNLKPYVLKWSEVDEEGKPRPVTFDHMRRLNYLLLADIKRVVTGFYAGDPIPGATKTEQDRYAEALALAAKGDEAPGLTQLREQQGNSEPG